jgi:YVTN family beta-propeller protein
VLVAMLLSSVLTAARPAPPVVHAAPVQDSPVLVTIAARPHTRRLVCAVDRRRAKTCKRTTRLRLAAGKHAIAVWAVGRGGRVSTKRRVTVVVPKPAPPAVAIGGDPVGIAASGSTLWVSGGSAGSVARVDTASRTVTARITVGGQLGGIAATQAAVWVSSFGGGSVARIDPATNAVVARVAVGGRPTSIAGDGSGAVWVGNLDGWASRIDPATNRVTAQVRLASGASTLLPLGNLLWTGLQGGSLVSIDLAAAALTGAAIDVAPDVDAIVSTPPGLWVSTFDGTAARVDPASRAVTRRVTLPGRGSGIAYASGVVWVSVFDGTYVVQLAAATGSLVGAVHTGSRPRESLVVGNALWVLDEGSGKLTPIPLA